MSNTHDEQISKIRERAGNYIADNLPNTNNLLKEIAVDSFCFRFEKWDVDNTEEEIKKWKQELQILENKLAELHKQYGVEDFLKTARELNFDIIAIHKELERLQEDTKKDKDKELSPEENMLQWLLYELKDKIDKAEAERKEREPKDDASPLQKTIDKSDKF